MDVNGFHLQCPHCGSPELDELPQQIPVMTDIVRLCVCKACETAFSVQVPPQGH